jgi:peptidoglycan hydrolase CwlO-like protein
MLGVVGDDRIASGHIFLWGLEIHVGQVAPGRKRTLLALFVEGLVAVGHLRLRGNPRGTKSQMAQLFARALGRPVSASDIGEALVLARDEGWDFVTLKDRTWTLRVGELLDIRSPLHRRFVERCIPAFDLRGVPQDKQPAANEPPSGLSWRLMQALLVIVTMLASGAAPRGNQSPAPAHDLAADKAQADLLGRDAQIAANRAEIAGRTAQLPAVQAERDEARAKLTGRDTQLAAVRADLAARDAQLAAVQAELDTARATRAAAEHRQAQADDAQPADLAARDAQLAAVQAELEAARASLQGRDAQLAAVRAELDTARASGEGRDAQLAAVQTELDTVRANLEDRDAQLAAVRVERDEALRAVAQRDDARRTLAARDEQIAALQVDQAEVRRALEARAAEVATLRGTLAAQEEQMARLEAKVGRVEALRASFSTLTATLPGDLNAARASLSAQASALPTASGATATTEPRGARGPPDGAGPR